METVLEKLLREREMSIRGLSRAADVHLPTLHKYVRGKMPMGRMRGKMLLALSRTLGVAIEYLVTNGEESNH